MASISFPSTAVLLIALVVCFILSEASLLTRRSVPDKCVYLKNNQFGEYLYNNGSPGEFGDADRNRVFTWIPKEDGTASEWGNTWGKHYEFQGMWLLKKKETICPDCYEIISLYDKDNLQTLCSEWFNPITAQSPPLFNSVFTYQGKDPVPWNSGKCIWVLEEDSTQRNVVRIKSFNRRSDDKKDEYLYSTADYQILDVKRRNVYTGTAETNSDDPTSGGIADWITESADCPTYVQ